MHPAWWQHDDRYIVECQGRQNKGKGKGKDDDHKGNDKGKGEDKGKPKSKAMPKPDKGKAKDKGKGNRSKDEALAVIRAWTDLDTILHFEGTEEELHETCKMLQS